MASNLPTGTVLYEDNRAEQLGFASRGMQSKVRYGNKDLLSAGVCIR